MGTQEEVFMRVDHHLVLILPEVLDGIGRPRVVLEAWLPELLGEVVISDFRRDGESELFIHKASPPSSVADFFFRSAFTKSPQCP